jgi:hypothetical protein
LFDLADLDRDGDDLLLLLLEDPERERLGAAPRVDLFDPEDFAFSVPPALVAFTVPGFLTVVRCVPPAEIALTCRRATFGGRWK